VKRALLIAAVVGLTPGAPAQDSRGWVRGFLESRSVFYPAEAENDPTCFVNENLLRVEGARRLGSNWKLEGGVDAQVDTHQQAQRTLHLSWFDRDVERPAFAVRSLFAEYRRGPFRISAGKQLLRWGVADLFAPTDRIAAHDALNPSGADYLGVWAVRAVADTGPNSLELIYLPRFTPSRAPLLHQRWVVLPEGARHFQLRFKGVQYPGGPQFGARYHAIRSPVEFSLSYFDGFQNLPSLPNRTLYLQRILEYRAVYPRTRSLGGDFTVPWRGVVWKAEAAYSSTPTEYTDNFVTYVVQAERLREKWQLMVGYTGTNVVETRYNTGLSVDRAFSRAFTGRASWTPRPRNTFSGEWFLQQNGKGFIGRWLYSRSLGRSLRLTGGYIRIVGAEDELIGRYEKNSHITLQCRYSF
jgi:hypothetical protein